MKHPVVALLVASLCALPLAACSDDSTSPDDDGGPQVGLAGAKGVTLREVSIYQSLKRQLMSNGEVVEEGVPLIAGRDAIVRVFYDLGSNFNGKVLARLEIEGGEPIEQEEMLYASSSEDDMTSTINFRVPGDRIGEVFEWRVSILQVGNLSDSNAAAIYPPKAEQRSVEGAKNALRVVLVPFRYDADGSGRVPDTSEAALESYRKRLMQLYPVSRVEIAVRGAIPWAQQITAFGGGWDEALMRTLEVRQQDAPPLDAYYYGIFDPEPEFFQYCNQGCVTGLAILNGGEQGPDEGQVDLRFAIGVGYQEAGPSTMAHELGHAHGREHADCGGADGVDPNFPHPGGQIGVWGLDTESLELFSPTETTDIMGYCENEWVSDYTYRGLFERGKVVNTVAKWQDPVGGAKARQKVAMVSIDGSGNAKWGGVTTTSAMGPAGRRLSTQITNVDGVTSKVEASYFAYDHLPGGIAFVPVSDDDVATIEVELDGTRHIAQP